MAAVADYKYDVFLSWKREEPVAGWFRTYFRPMFEAHLRSTLGHEPRIFLDERDVKPGDVWPARLRDGLRRSKVLVPIWEPQYFRSDWCMCELRSMVARERLAGLRSDADPRGLVLPVVVRDGRHFKSWLDHFQAVRLEDGHLTDAPAFRDCRAYVETFVPFVQRFCDSVEGALDHAPPWSADFPIIDEPGLEAAPFLDLPRFGPGGRGPR